MKYKLYFAVVKYFRFFARIVLKRWHPRVIAVMGSAGKSTALYLFDHVLSKSYKVKKSIKANSAYGITLDILDIHFTNYTKREWIRAFVLAPLRAARYWLMPYSEKMYIVELDVDRPGEMDFFASFLRPETVFWVSSYATHTVNFAPLVEAGDYKNAESAVAHEFAKLLSKTKHDGLLMANGDSPYIAQEVKAFTEPQKLNSDETGTSKIRNIVALIKDTRGDYLFTDWRMYRKRTEFVIKLKGKELAISIPLILPRNFGYTLVALYVLAQQYGIADSEVSTVLSEFTLLPGRLTILPGISDTVIIDSSYNSNFYATTGLLEVLKDYPGKRKIAVLGDMRELGAESKREHERLAEALIQYVPEHIVLVGPMMKEYVYPRLLENSYTLATVHQFDNTYQAGLFIKERLLKEGDVYLLKASQNTLLFEIIAEMLLVDKNDVNKLCRRETIWEEKRSEIKKSFYKSLHVG